MEEDRRFQAEPVCLEDIQIPGHWLVPIEDLQTADESGSEEEEVGDLQEMSHRVLV